MIIMNVVGANFISTMYDAFIVYIIYKYEWVLEIGILVDTENLNALLYLINHAVRLGNGDSNQIRYNYMGKGMQNLWNKKILCLNVLFFMHFYFVFAISLLVAKNAIRAYFN